jgi:hypothetical protein
LRKVLPELLSSPPEALSQRILRLIAELDQAWRRLDERIEVVSAEIESLSENNAACQRVLSLMRGSQVHWSTTWRGGEPTTSRTYPARCQS